MKREENRVGLGRRVFSWIFDWYVCGVLSSIPIGMMWMNISGTSEYNQELADFAGSYGLIAGLIGICVCFIYYVCIPLLVWKGQTPGKRLMGYKIIKDNQDEAGCKEIFLRQFVGFMILDAYLTPSTPLIVQLLKMVTGAEWVGHIDKVMFVCTIISIISVLFSKQHKAVHDYVAKTDVITINKKIGG